MSAIFRKTPKGDIEVQSVTDNAPVLISRSFRMVEGFRVDLTQWIDLNGMNSYIALRNPCIQMLNNSDDENCFGYDEDEEEADSCYMRYEGVVMLAVFDIHYTTDPNAFLLDLDGRALAGSNVYSDGNLCLGDSFNPLTLQAAELLLHNSANHDLGWRGGMLEGSRRNNMFHTTSWPTISRHRSLPDAILADIKRWWPT